VYVINVSVWWQAKLGGKRIGGDDDRFSQEKENAAKSAALFQKPDQ
jgi:hypothetical protein